MSGLQAQRDEEDIRVQKKKRVAGRHVSYSKELKLFSEVTRRTYLKQSRSSVKQYMKVPISPLYMHKLSE